MTSQQQHEFLKSVGGLFDRGVVQPNMAQLVQRLADDPESQAIYFEFVELDIELEWLCDTRPQPDLFDAAPEMRSVSVEGSPQPAASCIDVAKILPLPSAALRRGRSFFSASVLRYVALVALCLYGSFVLVAWNLRPDKLPRSLSPFAQRAPSPNDGREQMESDPFPSSIAMVRNATDVQWSKNTSCKPAESSILSGEPLKIDSGTIELELGTGTMLVVEGPADWSVDGHNSVSLRAGKLVAWVPERAVGFTVETPTVTVVDLGTEFGVEVDEQGEAEVHVFQGRVVAERAVASSAAPQRIELKKSEAARFTRDQTLVSGLSAAPERFPRSKQRTAVKPVLVQPSLLSGLQLWLKADGGVYSTFSDDGDFSNDVLAKVGNHVQAWQDSSDFHRDATQAIGDAQPVLVVNKRGWPALRFNGDDWLERAGEVLPPNGPQFTIFVVFQPDFLSPDTATALFGQFNNVNGAGHSNRFLNVQVGRQFVYDEYESPGGKALSTAARSITKNQIYVGCVTRNGVNRSLKLFSDNDTISVSDAAAEEYVGPAPRCWRLGSRQLDDNPCFLHGDIAEVLVFDRALDEKSRQHLETYLIAKYLNKSAVGNAPNGEPTN